MARYIGLFIVQVPIDRLRQLIFDVLESCNCNIIYDTGKYMMADEIPGGIPFSKLVKVQVTLNPPDDDEDGPIRMKIEMKNEELPFYTNNHCLEIFTLVQQSIEQNRQWHLVESSIG